MIKIVFGGRPVESGIYLKNTYLGKEMLSIFSDGSRQDIPFHEI